LVVFGYTDSWNRGDLWAPTELIVLSTLFLAAVAALWVLHNRIAMDTRPSFAFASTKLGCVQYWQGLFMVGSVAGLLWYSITDIWKLTDGDLCTSSDACKWSLYPHVESTITPSTFLGMAVGDDPVAVRVDNDNRKFTGVLLLTWLSSVVAGGVLSATTVLGGAADIVGRYKRLFFWYINTPAIVYFAQLSLWARVDVGMGLYPDVSREVLLLIFLFGGGAFVLNVYYVIGQLFRNTPLLVPLVPHEPTTTNDGVVRHGDIEHRIEVAE
jgi:hypothetical protein